MRTTNMNKHDEAFIPDHRPSTSEPFVMDVESKPHVTMHEESLAPATTKDEISPKEELKGAHEHIEGNALLIDRTGNIRQLPIPSSDPHDPLNFRPWEKWAVICACCWFCKSHVRRICPARMGARLTKEQRC
jgi:hypothetical protein